MNFDDLQSQDLEPLATPSPFLQSLGLAHLDQYFGAWACQESHLASMVDRGNRMNLEIHVQQTIVEAAARPATPKTPARRPAGEAGKSIA